MKGIGDQVIRVPLEMLQSMMNGTVADTQGWLLPQSVDVIGFVPRPQHFDPFVPDSRDDSVFIRIQHKYCFRRARGAALCIEDYGQFIERFRATAQSDMGK